MDTRVITQKHVSAMKSIAKSYPNTPVDLIRQCFEALQMYDLVDFLETAVKPISLRPVLSPEEVETLRTGDLPTKSQQCGSAGSKFQCGQGPQSKDRAIF